MTRSLDSAGGQIRLADLRGQPGAYLLVVRLDRLLDLELSGRSCSLDAGTYAYCGSARGPGGLAARLVRHLRIEKKAHWHIDHLTAAGQVVTVYARPGGSECALFEVLHRLPDTRTPLPGFGSSDCRRCPAHLVRVPSGFEALSLAGLIRIEHQS